MPDRMFRADNLWAIRLTDGTALLSGGHVGWMLFTTKGAATVYLRDYRKDAPEYMKGAKVVEVRLTLEEVPHA